MQRTAAHNILERYGGRQSYPQETLIMKRQINLIALIEELYDNATSSVYLDGDFGEWFRTTVGIRQGCLLSPTLFNIFLERIMCDALHEHKSTVSIGGRPVTNLRFADDIDGLAGSQAELAELIRRLDKSCSAYEGDKC